VRDIPDVSLFAADGAWLHYYVFCDSDPSDGYGPCTGDPTNWGGAGGTSFSSPIMAGIQALVNQSTGSRWGNPNTKYYSLAAAEYGTGGTSTCLSSNSPASTCIFNDITQGDMDVPCYSTVNCYGADLTNGYYGVLSTSPTTLTPAYGTARGWDFSTGIGSVNAYNLVTKWGGSGVPSVVSLSPNSGSGSTQTFAMEFSDTSGISDMTLIRYIFNTSTSNAAACSVLYYPITNRMFLYNDAGSGTLPQGLTPGVAGTVSNSQCTLNGGGSSVSKSGDTLTLNSAISFSSSFIGNKKVYLYAAGSKGNTGLIAEGNWTPNPVQPPTIVSMSPNSGSGSTQTFAMAFSDTSGVSDMTLIRYIFNTSTSNATACSVLYYPTTNRMFLYNDAGTGTLPQGLTPGVAGTVSNSQCTLNGGESSVSKSVDSLTLNSAISFSSSFTGSKKVYLYVAGSAGNTGLIAEGTWTP
jgi:hypothetical protein